MDPGDFIRVTSGLENWADWLDAWCANGEVHAGLAREAEGLGRRRTAGEAWARAALSYHFAKFVWMLDETRHRAAADRAVAAMANAHRLLDPAAERLEIEFDGITMYGNLRRPPGADRPPLVLLIARPSRRFDEPTDPEIAVALARRAGAHRRPDHVAHRLVRRSRGRE